MSLQNLHSTLQLPTELQRTDTQYSSCSADHEEPVQTEIKQDSKFNKIKKRKQTIPTWLYPQLKSINEKIHKSSHNDTEQMNNVKKVTNMLNTACNLRSKWFDVKSADGEHTVVEKKKEISTTDLCALSYTFKLEAGIMHIYHEKQEPEEFMVGTIDEFLSDLKVIHDLSQSGPLKSFCYKRLKLLELKFDMHLLLNAESELDELKCIPHRDFYNVRKVDTHLHHSASMNQKYLLNFIKNKYTTDYDKVVWKEWNCDKTKTLGNVFKELNIDAQHLSLNQLDVHAQQTTFQRFDRFNEKYNLLGQYSLRSIFLRFDNHTNGEYLAEITKTIFSDLKKTKYQFAEPRLSIGGIKKNEWDILAKWICNNNLHCEHVRWMIQIPRIYTVFKKYKVISSFHEILCNIFEPLFEVTVNPKSHPELYLFLKTVTGFDSVDDESKVDCYMETYPLPSDWKFNDKNPPYCLYLYYMYANIRKLNVLRLQMNMNTFTLRPHSGEAGAIQHLMSSFLLANSINHGINLHNCPFLEYLFYIKQIGLSLSPTCNNLLFKKFDENPFPQFFKRGLNVCLSTDDPLIIHYTENALIEEYSTIAKIYNLTDIDLCEISRNSVLQCGWSKETKCKWIGNMEKNFNDIYLSNVPNIRLQFRSYTLNEELQFIQQK